MLVHKSLVISVALVMLVGLLAAQTQTGSVSGVVVDASDAVVPGAVITLANTETGVARDLSTTAQGLFLFDRVVPGTYSLGVSKQGFRRTELRRLVVSAGRSSDIGKVRLEIGTANETVEVSGDAVPMVETQSAQLSGTFSAPEVKNLRSGMNGLDQMALLTPGVTPGFGNVNANGMQVSANGQRSRSTQFTMDGLQMNDITIGGPSFFLNNYDAIAQYQVVTNQFSAELGRNLGATVNIITKSGSNNMHGSGSWGYQASSLDAKSSLQAINNLPKPAYLNNTWSANLGGPVIRNHVFYFLSYRGRTQVGQTSDIGVRDTDNALTVNGINTLTATFPNSRPLQIYKQFGPFAILDGMRSWDYADEDFLERHDPGVCGGMRPAAEPAATD